MPITISLECSQVVIKESDWPSHFSSKPRFKNAVGQAAEPTITGGTTRTDVTDNPIYSDKSNVFITRRVINASI